MKKVQMVLVPFLIALLLVWASLTLLHNVVQAAPPFGNVAVFDDPAYVDTAGTFESEADNVQASLAALGHFVNPFTGINATDFSTALSGQDILLIPELEKGDLASALSVTATGVISNFVANGGGLIIHGNHELTATNRMPDFLNQVFGFSITSTGVFTTGSSGFHSSAADGTAFANGPAPLLNNDSTQGFTTTSLPVNSEAIYTRFDGTTVALIPFGAGQIVFLGWDWWDAAPVGTQDNGWLTVLDNAVHQLLPPDLRISKSVSPSAVEPGQPLTFTLTFSNAGGMADGLIPTNVTIDDVVPGLVTNLSFTSSGATITPTGGVSYSWDVENLAPSEGGIITITGILTTGLPAGTTFSNTASINTTTSEVDTNNNDSEVGVGVSNAAPVAVNANPATPEETPLSGTLLASDANGDPLTYSIVSNPSNGTVTISDPASGSFVYTPSLNFNGNDTFTFKANDGVADSNVASVTVSVTSINDPPSFTSAPNTTAAEGFAYNYAVTASDVDPGDVLTITAPTKPAWLTLTGNGNGTATLSGTPTSSDLGDHGVTLQVSDGALSATQTFTITVGEPLRTYLPIVTKN